MTTATINIPFPVLSSGSFAVVIKDSTNTTVFTGTETNTPFTASLAAGEYTCYATYNGNTVGYCFSVVDCACPVLPAGVITASGVSPALVYFLELAFDMSGGFPNCPFIVYYDDGVVNTSVTISSLADFTSNSGSTYTLKIHLYTNHVGYIITTPSGIGCTPGQINLVYSCHAPAPVTLALLQVGSDWYVSVTFTTCGASCHSVFINYNQHYFTSTPDAGGISATADCGLVPYTVNFLLSPHPTYYVSPLTGPGVAYEFFVTDCCGTNYYFNLHS